MKKLFLTLIAVVAFLPVLIMAEDARCPNMRDTLRRLQADQATHIQMSGTPDPYLASVIEDLKIQIQSICGDVITLNNTCADLGKIGIYPDCTDPVVIHTCAELGKIGTYPNCTDPVVNPTTCADLGKVGTYPNCTDPVVNPTCADLGKVGTYPNCTDPVVTHTCAELGKVGTYPNCTDPVVTHTCAELGKVGTYPDCRNPDVNNPDPRDNSAACQAEVGRLESILAPMSPSQKAKYLKDNNVHNRLKSMGCGGSDFGHLHGR